MQKSKTSQFTNENASCIYVNWKNQEFRIGFLPVFVVSLTIISLSEILILKQPPTAISMFAEIGKFLQTVRLGD